MEAQMLCLSRATDQELREELGGAEKYLKALTSGAILHRREESKKTEVQQAIRAIQLELEKRNTSLL
jgi:hypothetical protein